MTLTITIVGPAADVSAARAKTTTLGTGHFTITKKGAHKLTIKLSGAGKRLLRRDHGKASAILLEQTKIQGFSVASSRRISIKPARHR